MVLNRIQWSGARCYAVGGSSPLANGATEALRAQLWSTDGDNWSRIIQVGFTFFCRTYIDEALKELKTNMDVHQGISSTGSHPVLIQRVNPEARNATSLCHLSDFTLTLQKLVKIKCNRKKYITSKLPSG